MHGKPPASAMAAVGIRGGAVAGPSNPSAVLQHRPGHILHNHAGKAPAGEARQHDATRKVTDFLMAPSRAFGEAIADTGFESTDSKLTTTTLDYFDRDSTTYPSTADSMQATLNSGNPAALARP